MPSVIIADDKEENLYLLEVLLKSDGYDVTLARNGQQALEMARRNPPDLIISDILMPIMDGFTLCRLWRQDTVLKDIPFVFYTATYTDPKDERFALNLGADLFIVKPKEPAEFMSLICGVLSKHKKGELKGMPEAQPSQEVYLKEYNEALIRKLEDKLEQLEQSNRELAQKDVFNHAVLNSVAASMAVIGENGEVLAVNNAWDRDSKRAEAPDFLRVLNSGNLFRPGEMTTVSSVDRQIIEGIRKVAKRETSGFETTCSYSAEGKQHYFLMRATSFDTILPGVVIACFDVTAQKEAEVILRAAVVEREAMTRELYHRTKNNMQIISSILQLQALSSEEPKIKRLVEDTEWRIRALALVNQKLYESKNLSKIDMKDYLSELAGLLVESSEKKEVALSLDIDEDWILIDTAIPCGMIVNELISNSLKYAFPGDRAGKIMVGLHRLSSGDLDLVVADDGVGMPKDVDFKKAETLGLQTVRTIVERQLRGSIAVEAGPGVKYVIRFRDNLYKERI